MVNLESPIIQKKLTYLQEFYTVHDEDATFAAKEYFKTLSVIKEYGKGSSFYYLFFMIMFILKY